MKIWHLSLIAALSFGAVLLTGCASSDLQSSAASNSAFETGEYQNMFRDLLGKTDTEIQEKLDAAWQHLFYGDDDFQRVYYPVGDDMAYMLDVGNSDVRSEGMSYGM